MPKTNTPSLDARPDRLDFRDRGYLPPLKNLPNTFPLSSNVGELFSHYALECNLVLDQGEEGACTGFGLAAVVNYLNWKDHYLGNEGNGSLVLNDTIDYCVLPVSERMLYHNARLYDEWDGEDYEGSSCRGALKGWHRHGVCSAKLWPYRGRKGDVKFIEPTSGWAENAIETPLGAYYRIDKDSVVDMQSAIFEVGAIYCSSTVHEGWDNPTAASGVKKNDPFGYLPSVSMGGISDETGGHAFALVGYTRDGFIVQNSWGSKWGFNGFALISYEDWVRNGMDAWVVVRGAPTNKDRSPATVVHRALNEEQARSDDPVGQKIDQMRDGYPYKSELSKPWTEERAYQHTLIIGNNGRAIQKLIEFSSPESAITHIGNTLPNEFIEKKNGKHIVVYFHGGLNSEKDAIRRAQVLGPYFKANGIYPLFICWKTGLWETFGNILSDYFQGLDEDGRAGGVLEDVRDAVREKLDRTLEVVGRKAGGKSIWSEMKENAALACDPTLPNTSGSGSKTQGAMVTLGQELRKLENVDIHLVGHSAGAIIIGHWLHSFRRSSFKFKTLSLFAPACTVEFANRYYKKAIEKDTIRKKDTHFDILSDERERADSVFVYGKSLLYLVSRAAENMHKQPLLGMEAAWSASDEHLSLIHI